jgi:hypothetical protein
MPFDYGLRLNNRQRIANARATPIEANKNQSVDGAEGLLLRSGSAQNVYLLPQRQDFRLERCPRPKQIYDRPNNEPDKISHPATASPDSRSTASQIEFATGTAGGPRPREWRRDQSGSTGILESAGLTKRGTPTKIRLTPWKLPTSRFRSRASTGPMPAHRHRSIDPETPVQSFSRIGQDGHLHQMYPFHAMSSSMAKIETSLAALGLRARSRSRLNQDQLRLTVHLIQNFDVLEDFLPTQRGPWR